MAGSRTSSRLEIDWSDSGLEMMIDVDEEGIARLTRLVPLTAGDDPKTNRDRQESAIRGQRTAGLPLVDVVASSSGRALSARRYAQSVVGGRLRYLGHEESAQAPWRDLRVNLEDPSTGLTAEVIYTVLEGSGVLRSRVRLTNGGRVPVTLESVTSFLGSGLAEPVDSLDDVDLLWAENDWLAEDRWQVHRAPRRFA